MKVEYLLGYCKQLRDWCFRRAVTKSKAAPHMLLIWAPSYDDLTAHTSRRPCATSFQTNSMRIRRCAAAWLKYFFILAEIA
jgi:hypothetical protein